LKFFPEKIPCLEFGVLPWPFLAGLPYIKNKTLNFTILESNCLGMHNKHFGEVRKKEEKVWTIP